MYIEYQFCGVFLHRKRLYLSYEEGVRGPRRMLLPPKELPPDISAEVLGGEILEALGRYREAEQGIEAEEWERLNQELFTLFGERSVATFERNKRGVTARRQVASGEIQLFTKGKHISALTEDDPARLGATVKDILGI